MTVCRASMLIGTPEQFTNYHGAMPQPTVGGHALASVTDTQGLDIRGSLTEVATTATTDACLACPSLSLSLCVCVCVCVYVSLCAHSCSQKICRSLICIRCDWTASRSAPRVLVPILRLAMARRVRASKAEANTLSKAHTCTIVF